MAKPRGQGFQHANEQPKCILDETKYTRLVIGTHCSAAIDALRFPWFDF